MKYKFKFGLTNGTEKETDAIDIPTPKKSWYVHTVTIKPVFNRLNYSTVVVARFLNATSTPAKDTNTVLSWFLGATAILMSVTGRKTSDYSSGTGVEHDELVINAEYTYVASDLQTGLKITCVPIGQATQTVTTYETGYSNITISDSVSAYNTANLYE